MRMLPEGYDNGCLSTGFRLVNRSRTTSNLDPGLKLETFQNRKTFYDLLWLGVCAYLILAELQPRFRLSSKKHLQWQIWTGRGVSLPVPRFGREVSRNDRMVSCRRSNEAIGRIWPVAIRTTDLALQKIYHMGQRTSSTALTRPPNLQE